MNPKDNCAKSSKITLNTKVPAPQRSETSGKTHTILNIPPKLPPKTTLNTKVPVPQRSETSGKTHAALIKKKEKNCTIS